jgi:hypothetical protein
VKGFFGKVLIINAAITLVVGVVGLAAGWETPTFTVTLGLLCGTALFLGTAAFGGTGPASNIGDPSPGSGPNPLDPVARAAEVRGAFGEAGGPKGDYFERWRARSGWNPGNHRFAWLMIATGVLLGGAALVSKGLQ